jgi:mono/diheme cytochrome c family protein
MIASLAAMILGGVLYATAQEQAKGLNSSTTPPRAPASTLASTSSRPKLVHDATDARFEGEKRFRANCGRCHMAPHKFPPRMMVTIERHMRVRAMITDEDMRFILAYMTE